VLHPKTPPQELLLHTETLLRAALVRFEVHFDTLNRLLHVTSTMYRRSTTANINGAEVPTNHLAMGVLDVLSDSLKGKVRALPSTMTAMLEVCDLFSTSILLTVSLSKVVVSLHDDQNSYLPTAIILRACSDAVSYLSSPIYRETYGQVEFAASLAVVDLVLYASMHVDTFLMQSLVGETRGSTAVRVWNLVALGGLKRPTPDASEKLLVLLPHFVVAYVSLLRLPMSGTLNESASVNHGFASVKLWMLIARKACMHDASGVPDSDRAERMVWNELWPPFERLLVQSLSDGPNVEKPVSLNIFRSTRT
jgi:hypothetical protein